MVQAWVFGRGHLVKVPRLCFCVEEVLFFTKRVFRENAVEQIISCHLTPVPPFRLDLTV